MNKEQKRRMASKELIFTNPDDGDLEITYVVRVSGDRAELLQQWEAPWDNESRTGNDTEVSLWAMSTEDLKKLMAAAQWAVEESEALYGLKPLNEKAPLEEEEEEEENRPPEDPGMDEGAREQWRYEHGL